MYTEPDFCLAGSYSAVHIAVRSYQPTPIITHEF